jgi:putative restriction endonuclease
VSDLVIPVGATATRLEKAAIDNGFDQELPSDGDWLGFGSTQAPLRVWLTVADDGRPIAALSRFDVARTLTGNAAGMATSLPPGAAEAHAVADFPLLHRFLRRAWQLARTLPNELLHVFEQQTAAMPRATEVERLVVQRVGQDLFRRGLLDYWEGRCAVTGLTVPELLRASHIKPWTDCESDAERLDIWNGLLLAPHLDAAFDGGFITVADDGAVIVSAMLDGEARAALGLGAALRVRAPGEGHRAYLVWHRERVFKDKQKNLRAMAR